MDKHRKYSNFITALCFLLIIFFISIPTGKTVYSDLRERGLRSATTASIEQFYTDDFHEKEQFISYNGAFRRLINQRVVRDVDPNNMVIRIESDSLTSITWEYPMEQKAENMIRLYQALETEGIPFLYVQAPYKLIGDYGKLPRGITDYSNSNADKLLGVLEEAQVPYLDLRAELIASGQDLASLFFRTDHHWQIKTAFWAFNRVAGYLIEEYGLNLNQAHTRLENYTVTNYPQAFLGSQGKRVGELYVGLDDFDYIEADFPTSLTVTINRGSDLRIQEGDFREALIYEPLLDMSSITDNHYAAYFGGDYPEVTIENHQLPEGAKVLILKDSFALPFCAFLSTAAQELKMLDLRYLSETTALDFILNYQPDMVILMYSPSTFSSEAMFDFGA